MDLYQFKTLTTGGRDTPIKTIIMQLEKIVKDIKINDIIKSCNGWFIVQKITPAMEGINQVNLSGDLLPNQIDKYTKKPFLPNQGACITKRLTSKMIYQ